LFALSPIHAQVTSRAHCSGVGLYEIHARFAAHRGGCSFDGLKQTGHPCQAVTTFGRTAHSKEKARMLRAFSLATERISCGCRGSRCRSLCLALSAWRYSQRWSDR